nr:EboA domain-containing protein [Pontibacter silvestris]
MDWLDKKLELLNSSGARDKDLYLAFSATPRFVGKNKLQLSKADVQQANDLRTGFNPSSWTSDQTARTLLLLSLPHSDAEAFQQKIEKLFDTADMGEQVALYGSLPLLPHPELFKPRASEGVRTNIGSVFEAVVLDNPFSADYMEEDAWNQLVLKTIFVGKPINQIYGIDRRSNSKLAHMLSDYAHERWAAGRSVTPELWRPVGPFIDATILKDIKKLFSLPEEVQHEAAALACVQSNFAPAIALLNEHPDLKTRIEADELNWQQISDKALALN